MERARSWRDDLGADVDGDLPAAETRRRMVAAE